MHINFLKVTKLFTNKILNFSEDNPFSERYKKKDMHNVCTRTSWPDGLETEGRELGLENEAKTKQRVENELREGDS